MMKTLHRSIILVILITGLMISYNNTAHGILIPESTHDLLEKSGTIFVGNITATRVLQFENQYSYLVEENGTDKNITKNYTLNLDEYTVDVEEYLKNPQNSNKITVRQPTVGIIGELGGLDGFKTGDHVLFYVEKLDGNNTYSPESFILPTFCNGKDVLTQERPEGGSNFTVIQNGVKVDYGNFTANEPIQFLSSKDMGTLSGKSYDLEVGITRNSGGNTETVFSKEIHSSSKPCEWIATAEWGFTPQEGNYEMGVVAKEGGIITGTSDTGFTVKSDTAHTNQMPPLEQLKSGIAANDVKCAQGLQLVIKSEDGSPACVKLNAAYMLIKRGWATSESAYPGGDAQFVLHTNSTIIPAHLPRSSGVRIPYYESSRVVNYSGFDGMYNETFLYRGTQMDYVLKPGSTGVITFKIDAGASEQQGQDYPIPLPKSLNRTNYAVFYHEITSLEDLSKYPGVTFNDNGYGDFRACSTGPAGGGTCIGGPFGGTNPIEAFVTDHPGVDVLFEPPSEVLPLGMNATSQVITMMISVDSNAPRGTYLVELPSIGLDSFLLTVGNRPYHE